MNQTVDLAIIQRSFDFNHVIRMTSDGFDIRAGRLDLKRCRIGATPLIELRTTRKIATIVVCKGYIVGCPKAF